ncbi:IS66 family transposase [Chitinophaga agri]|uniref:IS66 family transposase n=1 Tax=Chitinophaga agri TaxID=2703787 RepID=A0A6B9ZCL4_9BACT|nr:IS66 family transposase [Chitinophaga agri]QHS58333.1 IS66 family transposase [Chitinophaga agri]
MRPELITSITDALQQVSTLTMANAYLSESVSRERITFGKIIYDLNNQLEAKQEECVKLNKYFHQAHKIMLDREQIIKDLEERILILEKANAEMREKAEAGLRKEVQLREFCDILMGKKSEKFIPESAVVNVAIQQTLGAEFDVQELEEIISVAVTPACVQQANHEIIKGNRKRKRYQAHLGRRVQPSWLEVQTETIDISIDKTGLKPTGKKVTTFYDYPPGKIIKVQQEHLQYINDEKQIICEPVKPRMVEKGTAGNRLLAYLHSRRFGYRDPYYRQLRFIKNTTGVDFAASTVDGWEEICYKKLQRLLRCLWKVIMQSKYIKADKTKLKYLSDVGKGKPSNGWLWVFLSPEHKLVLFEFNPSRSQHIPAEVLKDFKGILQTDGLGSYTAAFKNNDEVTMMSCLVHIRRGFRKAEAYDKKLVAEVLTLFNVIYRIEAYADKNKSTPDQRLQLRQKYTVQFLNKIKSGLLHQQNQGHLPGTPIAKAVNYALGQWPRLRAFTENGYVDPDNSGAERVIRPVTIFHKNLMFAGNEHGAERVALFYSLIESCHLNNIDPFTYLCDIYDSLHDCPANQLINLLPHNWKKKG